MNYPQDLIIPITQITKDYLLIIFTSINFY